MNPKYPVYIISKGRAESRLTSKTLEYMKVPYRIVIEPQEYDDYAAVIDPKKILVLPFKNLGQGSIPARNWVWEHAISEGWERHWLMDDNIQYFFRLNRNMKIPVADGTIFKVMEDFTDRYEDIAFSGPNYFMFASRKSGGIKPYTLNTRVYSCTLINNSLNHRWRGKYNEDTDICLRALKDGYRTILFNAFLQGKSTTMKMKGGNTDEVYIDGDNRLKFAQSLKKQHPDLVEITKKFGRYHHHVDYSPFKKNSLVKKPGVKIKEGIKTYGMKLIMIEEDNTESAYEEFKKQYPNLEEEKVKKLWEFEQC